MKKVFFSLAISFLILTNSQAQKLTLENVPAPVLTTFKAMFSIAEKTSWELQYDAYEAEFTVGKTSFSAAFDKDGKWVRTETFMKPSELPKPVKDKLIKEFGELSGYKIEDAEKIESADKPLRYELDVEKGELNYEMIFSESGELLQKNEVIEKNKE